MLKQIGWKELSLENFKKYGSFENNCKVVIFTDENKIEIIE